MRFQDLHIINVLALPSITPLMVATSRSEDKVGHALTASEMIVVYVEFYITKEGVSEDTVI